jgi:hypothetical protein
VDCCDVERTLGKWVFVFLSLWLGEYAGCRVKVDTVMMVGLRSEDGEGGVREVS